MTYKITKEKLDELWNGIQEWPYRYVKALEEWLGKNLEESDEAQEEEEKEEGE